jgi:DNA-binding response OmpR family regulator
MPKKLLIIDDEENLAKSLKASFQIRGYEVSLALNSTEGLNLVKEFNPEILLLDLHLSEGKTGLDVLREARAIKLSLKVIVLTGFGDEEGVEDECFRLGAIKFLPKAFTITKLIEEIESV